MADKNRTGKPPADRSKTYPPPHEEVWSDDTQAAVDQHLHGRPDVDRRDHGGDR